MLDQVASGQSNNSNQADSENLRQFNEQLARVRQRLFERESTVNQRVTRTFEIVDRAMMIGSTLQSRMAPGMAASLNFSRALSAQGLRPCFRAEGARAMIDVFTVGGGEDLVPVSNSVAAGAGAGEMGRGTCG